MADEFTHEFFELSSLAWNSNKVRRGPMYYYKCTGHFKTGRPCNRVCAGSAEFCKLHAASAYTSAKHRPTLLATTLTNGGSNSRLVDLGLRTFDNVV